VAGRLPTDYSRFESDRTISAVDALVAVFRPWRQGSVLLGWHACSYAHHWLKEYFDPDSRRFVFVHVHAHGTSKDGKRKGYGPVGPRTSTAGDSVESGFFQPGIDQFDFVQHRILLFGSPPDNTVSAVASSQHVSILVDASEPRVTEYSFLSAQPTLHWSPNDLYLP
jgi:hypothetical protein